MAIIADAGDFLTSASRLRVYENRFFSPAFHYSTGFAIPGSLGLQLSKPELRPIVLLSENSFNVSMIELHTLFQNKLNPIIFILSNNMNKFYNIEKFKQFFNFGNGFIVSNKDELDSVISTSLKSKEISLINVTFTKESI